MTSDWCPVTAGWWPVIGVPELWSAASRRRLSFPSLQWTAAVRFPACRNRSSTPLFPPPCPPFLRALRDQHVLDPLPAFPSFSHPSSLVTHPFFPQSASDYQTYVNLKTPSKTPLNRTISGQNPPKTPSNLAQKGHSRAVSSAPVAQPAAAGCAPLRPPNRSGAAARPYAPVRPGLRHASL